MTAAHYKLHQERAPILLLPLLNMCVEARQRETGVHMRTQQTNAHLSKHQHLLPLSNCSKIFSSREKRSTRS
jgi:hypothetical protein